MGKRILFLAAFVSFVGSVNNSLAQSSSSAYQRIELHIRPSIQFALLKAASAQFELSGAKKTENAGKEHEFRIRSNKQFMINVSTTDEQITSTRSKAGNMHAKAVEKLLSVEASTVEGGRKVTKASKTVSSMSNDLLAQGKRGEQLLAVNYKMNTNKQYPQGNYSVGVIYTATEP